MAVAEDYKELVKRHKNVNQDTLSNIVSDSHSRKLRDSINDWKTFLLELGLSESEVHLIDLQETQDKMKRLVAMRKWRKKQGFQATYANFLDTCLKLNETELAEKMLRLLNDHHEETSSPKALSTSEESVVPVQARVHSLDNSFMAMIVTLSDHIQHVPCEEITDFLLNSIPSELAQLPEYLHIMNSDEVDKFEELIRIIDFWNTELLDKIVQEFGTEKCKHVIMSYHIDVETFYIENTIGECTVEGWKVREWCEEDVKSIELKLGDAWGPKTLLDLIGFKRKLQRKARFERYELRLQCVGDTCTLVLVSQSADISKINRIESDFFRNNDVLRVSVGEKTIYNVESPKNYEPLSTTTHYLCPITKQLMLEPHKTSCCNKHLSHAAIEQSSDTCPICMSTSMDAKLDPIFRERAHALKISCPHKYEGCHWIGEIRHLKAHLNGSENACRYALVSCPLCGLNIQRYSVEKHLTKCSKQQRCKKCQKRCSRGNIFCGDCSEPENPCPYKCGEEIRPADILSHLKKCSKLATEATKDETDDVMSTVESTSLRPEYHDQFLDLAKSLLEKRLSFEDVRCELCENLLCLATVRFTKGKGHDEKIREKQELRDVESLLLQRENEIQEEMVEIRSKMQIELEEHGKIQRDWVGTTSARLVPVVLGSSNEGY